MTRAFPRLASVACFTALLNTVCMFPRSWHGWHLLTLAAGFPAFGTGCMFSRACTLFEFWLVHCNVNVCFDRIDAITLVPLKNKSLLRINGLTGLLKHKCQKARFGFYLRVDDRAVQHRCSHHHKMSEEFCKASSWSSIVKCHLKQLE